MYKGNKRIRAKRTYKRQVWPNLAKKGMLPLESHLNSTSQRQGVSKRGSKNFFKPSHHCFPKKHFLGNWRDSSVGRSICYRSMKTLVQIPSTHHMNIVMVMCVCNPSTEDKDVQILRACWPACLDQMVSSQFSEMACVKAIQKILDVHTQSHSQAFRNLSHTRDYVWIWKHIDNPRRNPYLALSLVVDRYYPHHHTKQSRSGNKESKVATESNPGWASLIWKSKISNTHSEHLHEAISKHICTWLCVRG